MKCEQVRERLRTEGPQGQVRTHLTACAPCRRWWEAEQASERDLAMAFQAVPVAAPTMGNGFLLTTGRSLYTSYDGAVLHSPEADKLHREEFVEISPAEAARLGISPGDEVTLKNGRGELTIRAKLTEAVQRGMLFVPLYYDGGAVSALFGRDEAVARVQVAR